MSKSKKDTDIDVMNVQKTHLWSLLLLVGMTVACTSPAENKIPPTDWIQDQPNQLFLGYYFGMDKQDFFTHSWELNKEQEIQNGAGAEILREETSLKAPANAAFYPTFNENDQINSMPMTYTYKGWAPWNQHLSSDSLAYDIQQMLSDSLQISFETIVDGEGLKAYRYDERLPMIGIQPIDQYRVRVIYALDYETLERSIPAP